MSYDIAGSKALINGADGQYGTKAKGVNYGKNAAVNHLGYIKDFEIQSKPLNPDVFTKSGSVEDMYNEVMTKCKEDKMPPIDFLLRYTPKKGAISGFFAKLFKGHSIDTKALIGFTSEAMGKKAMTVEEADKELNEAFGYTTNTKLSAKAFDVNNDGMIDVSEEAVSTVLADVLSKDDTDAIKLSKKDLKKADGSYTNKGENKMMAFCNEENYETASKAIKDIHKKMKLDKAAKKLA